MLSKVVSEPICFSNSFSSEKIIQKGLYYRVNTFSHTISKLTAFTWTRCMRNHLLEMSESIYCLHSTGPWVITAIDKSIGAKLGDVLVINYFHNGQPRFINSFQNIFPIYKLNIAMEVLCKWLSHWRVKVHLIEWQSKEMIKLWRSM